MSILIKGMDMPKHCLDCPLKDIEDNCKAQELEEWGSWEDLRKGCPLIEIPIPHGDLVDKDDLKLSIEYFHGRFRFVNESSIVIESEE